VTGMALAHCILDKFLGVVLPLLSPGSVVDIQFLYTTFVCECFTVTLDTYY